jgi:hypothetical protein
MAVATFTRAAARAGTTTPLVWLQWVDSGGTTHYWSDRPIGDNPEKRRKVLSWRSVRHLLSSDNGQLSGNQLAVQIDDSLRELRVIVATEATRYVLGQPVDLWVTTRDDRAIGNTAMRVFRGRWKHPQLNPSRLITLTAEDYITQFSDPAVMAKDMPKRRLAFGAQSKLAGFGEPIIYGDVNAVGLGSNGAVGGIYIADIVVSTQLYRVLMIAGHACKAITEIYYNGTAVPPSFYGTGAGASILAPGKANWPFGANSYFDYNGRRYTAIGVLAAALNPDDVHRFTFDVQGIETVGDGTGALITNYFDAYLHFLKNFGLGDWQTGAWLAAPTWPDASPMIDTASFAAAQAVTVVRMGGAGYQVRTVIGADGGVSTLQDVLSSWNLSGDCRSYMWDGQFGVVVPNRAAAATLTITEDEDLLEDPPTFTADESQHFTHVHGYGWPHFARHELRENKWEKAAQSITPAVYQLGTTGKPYAIKRWGSRTYWMSHVDSAANAFDEWLWRHRHPPIKATFQMALPGLHVRPGMYLNLTHREGSATLITDMIFVEEVIFDFDRLSVTVNGLVHLTGSMLDPITRTSGTMPATDTSVTASSGAGLPTVVYIPGPSGLSPDVRDLGGTLTQGLRSAAAVAVPQRKRPVLTAGDRVNRSSAIVRAEVRTDNVATTVTPEVWNSVTGTLIKSGAASNSLTGATQAIDVSVEFAGLVGDIVPELRIKGSNAIHAIYGQGDLEIR